MQGEQTRIIPPGLTTDTKFTESIAKFTTIYERKKLLFKKESEM